MEIHLDVIRRVVRDSEPIVFGDLAETVKSEIESQDLPTSPEYIAKLVLAATRNTGASFIVYPDVPKFLIVDREGNYGIRSA